MNQVFLSAEPHCARVGRQTVLSSSSARSPWLCAHAVVGREEYAQQNIEALGYETYLPRHGKVVSHARRRRVVRRAFFPGYLFVAAGHTPGAAAAVNRSHGVLAVVGGPRGDTRVPERLIGELRARENKAGLIAISADRFRSGQKVQIATGPLTGVTAMFAEASDDRRAVILIELLGKSHRVSVCPSALDIFI